MMSSWHKQSIEGTGEGSPVALGGGDRPRSKVAWRPPLGAALGYLVALTAATWPFARTFAGRLPSLGDPLQHLWVMRWYKHCLMEWQSPMVAPGLQYPVGAPLGNFSPLHLQSIVYLIVSAVSDNDVLCYNLVWLAGMMLTGMGTYALGRSVLRDESSAFLAGLLTMLSGPVMVHAHSHTELIYVGGISLFLLAWIRFIDRPSFGRLLAAVGGYLLVAMCAAYFLVFAIFPAVLFVVWRWIKTDRSERLDWTWARGRWLLGFVVLCLPGLALLYSGQIAMVARGMGGIRPRSEFDAYGAPWWSYVVPVPGQLAHRLLPFDPFGVTGTTGEGMCYLGLVTLLLLHRAAVRRSPLPDAAFWWIAAGLLAVLSLGSSMPFDGGRLSLPAGWLRDCDWFLPFRLIRVPARFKLFVPVFTGIIAGSAWKQLRSKIGSGRRVVALSILSAAAVADLAHVPFGSEALMPIPDGYAWLRNEAPEAAWVDVPQMCSSNAHWLNSNYTYWQSLHGGRTTGGYSGHQNHAFDDLLTWNSPFADYRLIEPEFPRPGGLEHYDRVEDVAFLDYAWLYLHRHGLRFVVLHRWAEPTTGFGLQNINDRLAMARRYEDDSVTVIDRDLLPEPTGPAILCAEGWGAYRLLPRDGFVRLVGPLASVDAYIPETCGRVILTIHARSIGETRRVRIVLESETIWSGTIGPDAQGAFETPPFLMPEGMSTIRIESDGTAPVDLMNKRFEGAVGPASLIVSSIALRPADGNGDSPVRFAGADASNSADDRR